MKFGVITDIQYADADTPEFAKQRLFRLSLKKLTEVVEFFNTQDLDFIVNLGDTVDWGIENFKPVVDILNTSKHTIYHVLGNHDFYTIWPSTDERIEMQEVLRILSMPNNYYSVDVADYRLLFIDNNEVGIIEHPKGSQEYEEGQRILEEAKAHNLINAQSWNGAVSNKQLEWIKQQTQDAATNNQKVLLFAHAQIYPEHRENMLQKELILDVIDKNKNVLAFMNGHNHDGDFGVYNDVPCITFKGMLDTETNSYAVVNLADKHIEITGYGREESRNIKTRS